MVNQYIIAKVVWVVVDADAEVDFVVVAAAATAMLNTIGDGVSDSAGPI